MMGLVIALTLAWGLVIKVAVALYRHDYKGEE